MPGITTFRIHGFISRLVTIKTWSVLLVIAVQCALPCRSQAQQDSILDQIYAVLILDSLTVTADRKSPDIKSMIDQTIHDTTFYQAFQRLRRESYRFSSELYFFKPGWIPYTYMRSIREQQIIDGKRINVVVEEHKDRNIINRKGEYEFYTATLYDRLFFTHHPTSVPVSRAEDISSLEEPDSRMQKYIHDLKLLLFAPGTEIDLPLMGNKTAIFTDQQIQKYQFTVAVDTTSFPQPVYEFSIQADPAYSARETVIKELTTVFDKNSLQVLHRSYKLAYNTVAYQFDVTMQIQVQKRDGIYLPTFISYEGWWDIPFRKPEYCRFTFQMH